MQARCGIPMIQIEGTAADWKLIADRIAVMKGMFAELEDYFGRLIPVIEQIIVTIESGSGSLDFWRSLYKVNEHSGCVEVDGWLTTLLAYKNTKAGRVLRLNSDKGVGWGSKGIGFGPSISPDMIPTHISKVPFIWEYYGKEMPMTFFAGILGVERVEATILRPRLGFGVGKPSDNQLKMRSLN